MKVKEVNIKHLISKYAPIELDPYKIEAFIELVKRIKGEKHYES